MGFADVIEDLVVFDNKLFMSHMPIFVEKQLEAEAIVRAKDPNDLSYCLKKYHRIAERFEEYRKDIRLVLHGHLHQNMSSNTDVPHVNVCVDVTDFKPVNLDEILDSI